MDSPACDFTGGWTVGFRSNSLNRKITPTTSRICLARSYQNSVVRTYLGRTKRCRESWRITFHHRERLGEDGFDRGRNRIRRVRFLPGRGFIRGYEFVDTEEFRNPMRRRVSGSGRNRTQLSLRAAVVNPYDILGVSRKATDKDIKQAYRKLALKYHPDVNKEADAQSKFMQIKGAYHTLIDGKSRAKYDASSRATPQWEPFTWEKERPYSQQPEEEEPFYGIGDFFKDIQISVEDFFRDLQSDYRNKERLESKPKSLWEELADIGEEFVDFLEKELNISDSDNGEKFATYEMWDDKKSSPSKEQDLYDDEGEKEKVESEIAEIEEILAKIKKDMGL